MSYDNETAPFKLHRYLLFVILAIFSLVSCSSDDSAGSGQVSSDVEKRTAPIGQVDVAVAGDTSEKSKPAAETSVGKKTFDSVCFACHLQGIAGAPKYGDKKAWKPHLEKGTETLYEHALHGFTGSNGTMPAKGGRADLADDDIKAAVNYMLAAVGATPAAAATEEAPAASEETAPAAVASANVKGKEVFDGTCSLCHKTGVAGAPKFGDKEAWKPRIAKGNATLYDHAIHGFMGKGMMPPKGGKADLSDGDVKAAVDYMVENGS